MSATGEVTVAVGWDGARLRAPAVAVGRPEAARLLVGRTVDEARLFVPRLYSICARAQAAAAEAALAAALGRPLAGAGAGPSSVALAAEAAQEHLWRLLRDWPAAVGLPTLDAEFARWYRRLAATATDGLPLPALLAFVDEVVGTGWERAADLDQVIAWARRDERLAALLLRVLVDEEGEPMAGPGGAGGDGGERADGGADGGDAEGVGWLSMARPLAEVVAQLVDEPAAGAGAAAGSPPGQWPGPWIDRPTLATGPAETGPLARRRHAPAVADGLRRRGRALSVRLLARLHDLLAVARELAGPRDSLATDGAAAPAESAPRVEAQAVAPGVGVARVDTARGVLLHAARVRLDDGRVQRYAIVAPTAWNFHPAGALAHALDGLAVTRDAPLHAAVARWVLALDPCVPWKLEVRGA